MVCLLGSNSNAGVLTSDNYDDKPTDFKWTFNWDGQVPSSVGVGSLTETLIPDGQVEWKDVSALLRATLFTFEPNTPPVFRLTVRARHVISPADDSHLANSITLVIGQDVTNLATSTDYVRFAEFAAESHNTHSDWMYLSYKKAAGEESVSFKLEGEHLLKIVPEPTSGMIAAGLLASFTYLRRRRRRLGS